MRDSEAASGEQRIRVVHVASGDLWAGAEAQVYALTKELNKLPTLDLDVVLLNHGILEQRLLKHSVRVTVFDEKKLNSLQILKSLYRFLKGVRADVVHTHRQKENVLGAFASVCVPSCRSIRTVHGAPEFPLKLWRLHKTFYRMLDWFSGRFLQDRMVAVSNELGTLLTRRFTSQKVQVIENGVDVDELVKQSQLPVDLPGPTGAFKVAFVGRLVPIKRVDLFLEIAKQLLSEDPKRYRFYIFGDGPLREQAERQAQQLQIDPYLYRMGLVEDLPAHLARMSVLVMTSDHEGLPMSLLEALALGVPVVAHAVGGIPEVLGKGAYGELVNIQMPTAYAEKIRALAESNGVTRRERKDGADVVSKCYSASGAASAYLGLYKSLLLRRSPVTS
jgi:glycosyltransferase involved in cell wall biosynthesis